MAAFERYWRAGVVTLLFVLNMIVWGVGIPQDKELLHVYILDVGQGDAIFIESPNGGRALIDGGPDRSVLAQLGKVLPLGTKRIDVAIETHPDRDHIGGLPEVISRYEIGAFLEPGVESENQIDDELQRRVGEKHIPNLLARRNMVIDFGDGTQLRILFPNTDVSKWETNDASIVARLTYGDTSFLLTGDASRKTEFILLSLDKEILKSDVLKVGHHGSRTSTSRIFAEAVKPAYAVISAAKNNSYGHPHAEVTEILQNIDSKIVSTGEQGTIIFQSDGKNLVLK